MYKLILVKQEYEYEDDEPTLSVREVTLSELLNDSDPEIQTHLRHSGWANVQKIVDKDIKLVLNKKFFTISGTHVFAKRLDDLENLHGYELTGLANGGFIAQEVSLESVLTPQQFAEYRRLKSQIDKTKKEQRQTQEQRAARRKAKEIEKAKKVLEANGLKVEETDS